MGKEAGSLGEVSRGALPFRANQVSPRKCLSPSTNLLVFLSCGDGRYGEQIRGRGVWATSYFSYRGACATAWAVVEGPEAVAGWPLWAPSPWWGSAQGSPIMWVGLGPGHWGVRMGQAGAASVFCRWPGFVRLLPTSWDDEAAAAGEGLLRCRHALQQE